MAEITASLVKELRERTGAGMMDCKKALTEANGDIELAIENMRKSGAIKAAKKAGNVAADGVIKTKIDGNYGIIRCKRRWFPGVRRQSSGRSCCWQNH